MKGPAFFFPWPFMLTSLPPFPPPISPWHTLPPLPPPWLPTSPFFRFFTPSPGSACTRQHLDLTPPFFPAPHPSARNASPLVKTPPRPSTFATKRPRSLHPPVLFWPHLPPATSCASHLLLHPRPRAVPLVPKTGFWTSFFVLGITSTSPQYPNKLEVTRCRPDLPQVPRDSPACKFPAPVRQRNSWPQHPVSFFTFGCVCLGLSFLMWPILHAYIPANPF